MKRLSSIAFVFLLVACQGPGGEIERILPDPELLEDVGDAREALTTTAACEGENGDGSYCSPECPCDDGHGDCDGDEDCVDGLRCYRNVGEAFGFDPDVDMCMAACPSVGNGSLDFCSEECPCESEQGDCDSDAECGEGLACVSNIGADFGYAADVDVCVSQCSFYRVGKFDYCSADCLCAPGHGDCDSDADCQEGLRCARDVGLEYGFDDPEIDVCVGAAATTSATVTVLNLDGVPIPGARVSLGAVEDIADDQGIVMLDDVAAGRAVIQVSAAGYTEAALDIQLVQGDVAEFTATLHSLGQPTAFVADEGAEVFDDDVVRLDIPAGALIDADGNPVTGEVAVTVAEIDPERVSTDVGSIRAIVDGEEVVIEQGRVLDVSFWQGDDKLQIQPGTTVTMDVPLLDADSSGLLPGDATPVLTYDLDQGVWVEDTVGTVMSTDEGELFARVEIEHTSWFVLFFFLPPVVVAICHLECAPCNPCEWRDCTSPNSCERKHEKVLKNNGSVIRGCSQHDYRANGEPLPAAGQTAGDCRERYCEIQTHRECTFFFIFCWGYKTNTTDTIKTRTATGDTPDDGNACTEDTCSGGTPTHTPVPAETLVPGFSQTPNDCQATVCDGNGGQEIITDVTDLPADDDNPCTDEICNGETPEYVPVAENTPVPGLPQTPGDCQLAVCDGSGRQFQLTDVGDLPADDSNPCTEEICNGDTPEHAMLPLDTPVPGFAQTPNDCRSMVCDGTGGQLLATDSSDVPLADGNPCTDDICNGPTPYVNVPEGSLVPGAPQPTGDCQDVVCDGSGGQTQITNASDIPGDDGSACTDEVCIDGTPSHSPLAAGIPVPGAPQTSGDCQSVVCDGSGGQESIVDDGDVPSIDNACVVQTCEAGGVVTTPVAADTPVPGFAQVEGDCLLRVCDGAGGQANIGDLSDLPQSDGNQCTDDICDGLSPSYPATPAGESCDEDGGFYCDGDRVCVECLNNEQCASLLCSAQGTCLPPTCVDGIENGDETAIDCGGSECDACGAGSPCVGFGDCDSGVCAGGTCLAARCNDFVQNGDESGRDCGGPTCAPCDAGEGCFSVDDCSDGLICLAGECASP